MARIPLSIDTPSAAVSPAQLTQRPLQIREVFLPDPVLSTQREGRVWDPPSLLAGTNRELFFPGVKWPGLEPDHLPQSTAKVNASIPPFVFMAQC
jgi:hypothetical protein